MAGGPPNVTTWSLSVVVVVVWLEIKIASLGPREQPAAHRSLAGQLVRPRGTTHAGPSAAGASAKGRSSVLVLTKRETRCRPTWNARALSSGHRHVHHCRGTGDRRGARPQPFQRPQRHRQGHSLGPPREPREWVVKASSIQEQCVFHNPTSSSCRTSTGMLGGGLRAKSQGHDHAEVFILVTFRRVVA